MMKYYFYLILIFKSFQINAQRIDTIKSKFSFEKNILLFTLLKIGSPDSSNEKIPLVLFLHGAGERGNDNKSQLQVGLPLLVNTALLNGIINFWVLVPQCPEDSKWVNTDWTKSSHSMDPKLSYPLNLAISAMDSIIKSNQIIEQNRIYITGLSMGGFGTWELIQRFPNKFAAAVPVCGGGDTNEARKTKLIMPIWAFHGRKDKIVKVSRSIEMINAVKKRNAFAKLTIYESEGHLCWNRVYSDSNLLIWLFLQKRSNI